MNRSSAPQDRPDRKNDEMPDELARSATTEIRDRQPVAVSDAGDQDDLCRNGEQMTYMEWIANYEREQMTRIHVVGATTPEERLATSLRGSCSSATEAMVVAFPELKRVRGHYGHAPHWWCLAPDGTIVDPTKAQFGYVADYVEYHGPEPVGKCMNCGDYVWSMEFGSCACSDECARSLELEYNAVLR